MCVYTHLNSPNQKLLCVDEVSVVGKGHFTREEKGALSRDHSEIIRPEGGEGCLLRRERRT